MTREAERREADRGEASDGSSGERSDPRESEASERASGERETRPKGAAPNARATESRAQSDPRASGLATDGGEVEVPEVTEVTGSGVPIRGNDIDTDQIIPARFLKVVTFDGLGQFAFFDQRYTEDDEPKDHPLNEDRYQGASIMVVNANFGCGSSREHAPQALMRWGIDALVGESFAEIFAGNCLALGIPTVEADAETVRELQDWVEANPDGEIHVDVAEETVEFDDRMVDVTVDDGQRKALVDGIWDTTALMKANREAIAQTADGLPYVGGD